MTLALTIVAILALSVIAAADAKTETKIEASSGKHENQTVPAGPKLSDVFDQIDYGKMEKDIYEDLNKELNKLDIAAIVEKRIKERLEEIKWKEAITDALAPAIDEHVD